MIESTLGLTAFEFITRLPEPTTSLLPGLRRTATPTSTTTSSATSATAIWYLREAARDPALAAAIRAKLGELLPAVASALAPPDRDGTDWEALGASSDEIRQFALDGLTRRLAIIGVALSAG